MNKLNIFSIIVFSIIFNSILLSQDALKKGSYSLSGSIEFSAGSDKFTGYDNNFLDFTMSPGTSYFFIDHLSTGVNISYGYFEYNLKSTNNSGELKLISRPISIGPVIRYYFASEPINPFVEASYRYSNSITGNQDRNGYSFAVGINYFLSTSVALEPYVAYENSTYIEGDEKTSGVSIGVRINYFIIN